MVYLLNFCYQALTGLLKFNKQERHDSQVHGFLHFNGEDAHQTRKHINIVNDGKGNINDTLEIA